MHIHDKCQGTFNCICICIYIEVYSIHAYIKKKQKLSMFKRNSKMNYSPQDPHLPELTRPFPAPRLFHGKLRHSALLAGCFGEGGHFSMGNHWQIHMPLLFLIILYFPGTLWWRVFLVSIFCVAKWKRGVGFPPYEGENWGVILFAKCFT